ncbi:MAG TPA: Dabb family protein [Ktedonobacteraceae bacterium]
MITHIVLLQPQAATTEQQLATFFDAARDLQRLIPGIISISAGKNRSPYRSAYTHGIIMRFIDEAHLQAHHPHPAHLAVVEELDRLCESSIDFDLPETFVSL